MKPTTQLVPLAATLALLATAGACKRSEQAPEPEPTVSSEAPQNSIIRPDREQPETQPPPLAPLEARISFALGGNELSDPMQAELATILRSPQMRAGGPVTLRAHTDSDGSDEVNLRASRTRGEVVRDWLVENGVAEERITIIAFGEQNPLQPNALPDGRANDAGRAANRRVDLHIAVPDVGRSEPTLVEEMSEEDGRTPAARTLDESE